LICFFSIFIFIWISFFNEFKGYFNKVPETNPLCIPITFLVDKFNIGLPDEPDEVLLLCSISYLLSALSNKSYPKETEAFNELG